MSTTINHQRSVVFKDGRSFFHECDDQDCQVTQEALDQGFHEIAPFNDVEYAYEWKTRGELVPSDTVLTR